MAPGEVRWEPRLRYSSRTSRLAARGAVRSAMPHPSLGSGNRPFCAANSRGSACHAYVVGFGAEILGYSRDSLSASTAAPCPPDNLCLRYEIHRARQVPNFWALFLQSHGLRHILLGRAWFLQLLSSGSWVRLEPIVTILNGICLDVVHRLPPIDRQHKGCEGRMQLQSCRSASSSPTAGSYFRYFQTDISLQAGLSVRSN